MTRPRPWPLLLACLLLAIGTATVDDPPTCEKTIAANPTRWDHPEILQQADALFDPELCFDGLQWVCFVARTCYSDNSTPNDLIELTDKSYDLKWTNGTCPVLAIQPHTQKKWRVVMHAKLTTEQSVVFAANCIPLVECKPKGSAVEIGKPNIDTPGLEQGKEVTEMFGRYEGGVLMCEFTIVSKGENEIYASNVRGTEQFAIISQNLANRLRPTPILPAYMSSTSIRERVNKEVKDGVMQGCVLNLKYFESGAVDEDFKPFNMDWPTIGCPAGYDLRWAEKSGRTPEFRTTHNMTCASTWPLVDGLPKKKSVFHVDGVTVNKEKLAHCARKKCRTCPPPPCSSTVCPSSVVDEKIFANCGELRCQDPNYHLVFAGNSTAVPVCATNGSKWMMGAVEAKGVECVKNTCDAKVDMDDPEKFNITKAAIMCKASSDVIGYAAAGKKEVQLSNLTCDFATSQWLAVPYGDGAPEPYTSGTLNCQALPAALAKGSVLLYSGIALGVILVIVGVVLFVFLCLNRKKKKKESALKNSPSKTKLSNDSKSKESKSVSKGKSAANSPTRSVTGARTKKTEERSKPPERSSIVKTSELKKVQKEEEERKMKTAMAALLESSNVEDEKPAPVAPSGETVSVDPAKGSRDELIPDKAPAEAKEKPKLRPKAASLIDAAAAAKEDAPPRPAFGVPDAPARKKTQTDPTQNPSTAPSVIAKTQLGGPDDEDDEHETPMWPIKPAAAPTAPAAPAEAPQVETKPSAEKAAGSAEPAAKKTTSVEGIKMTKGDWARSNMRPTLIKEEPSDDFTSSKKKVKDGSDTDKMTKDSMNEQLISEKEKNRGAKEPSKKVDGTQPPSNGPAPEEN